VKVAITWGNQNNILKETIERNVSNLLFAFNKAEKSEKKPSFNNETITSDARSRIVELWANSPLKCTTLELEGSCLNRPSGGYQLRNIPVTMTKAPENEQNQSIVINLTADGKIDDIFIPLTDYATVLNEKKETEDLDVRLMVLDFVENFRTAYNRKDIKFLNMLFSDNAVIITGKAIKPIKNTDSQNLYTAKAQFELQIKTKKEYMKSLESIFKKNRFIDVKFNDIIVVEHRNIQHVYGITLKQDWKSSMYADKGYVFLLIDYRNEQVPVITVRTWQPEEYDGRPLAQGEIFQIGDFNVSK
jgi:predicted nucleic acid-binding protein